MKSWIAKMGAVAFGLCVSVPAFAAERNHEVRQQARVEHHVQTAAVAHHEGQSAGFHHAKTHHALEHESAMHQGRMSRHQRVRLANHHRALSHRIHGEKRG